MRAAASLIIALLLALAGCVESPEESVNETPDPVTPVPAPATDDPNATSEREPDNDSDSTSDTAAGDPPEDAPSTEPEPRNESTDEPRDDESTTDSAASGGETAPDNQSGTNASAPAPAPEPHEEPEPESRDEPEPDSARNDEPAQEEQENETWPRNGSYARYHVDQGGGSPGGTPQMAWDVDVLMTFDDGNWTARCTGTVEHREHNGTWTENVNHSADLAPPRADTNVSEGDNLTVPGFNAWCDATTHPVTVVDANASYATNRSGEPVNVSAWYGYREPLCGCMSDEASWEHDIGFVLEWRFGGKGGGWRGTLLDTDAPIG